MAIYRISSICKDDNDVITHYGFHTKLAGGGYTLVKKVTKAKAIEMLEAAGSSAMTWVWNYSTSRWVDGENVEVVGSGSNKYLRTNPDRRLTDNLAHLINLNWFIDRNL